MHELSISPGGLVPGSVLLNRGVEYAKELLRMRYDGVVSEISRFATVSLPSAAFITGVVSFAALDSIGRYLGAHNVETEGLALWIKTHSDGIRAAVPAGLEVKQALGIQHYPWETKTIKKRRSNALVAVLVLIIVIVGAFFAYRYHEQHPTVFAPTSDTLAPASAAAPAARDTVPARSN
jgi:integral membrane sensor domain MASE1